MSGNQSRFLRRLAHRRRLDAGSRFGDADPRQEEDRRTAERRAENLTGDALTARLRELGISANRRKGDDRRQRDRRR